MVKSKHMQAHACAASVPMPRAPQKVKSWLTQQEPHAAWSLTGLSAGVPRQSTVDGSMVLFRVGMCRRTLAPLCCMLWKVGCCALLCLLGSMSASNSSWVQSANLLASTLQSSRALILRRWCSREH